MLPCEEGEEEEKERQEEVEKELEVEKKKEEESVGFRVQSLILSLDDQNKSSGSEETQRTRTSPEDLNKPRGSEEAQRTSNLPKQLHHCDPWSEFPQVRLEKLFSRSGSDRTNQSPLMRKRHSYRVGITAAGRC